MDDRRPSLPRSIPEKKLFPWQCESSRVWSGVDWTPPTLETERVHPNSLGPFVFLPRRPRSERERLRSAASECEAAEVTAPRESRQLRDPAQQNENRKYTERSVVCLAIYARAGEKRSQSQFRGRRRYVRATSSESVVAVGRWLGAQKPQILSLNAIAKRRKEFDRH